LSIKPSSIAAMRTLRAKGEAGENVSFILNPQKMQAFRHGRAKARSASSRQISRPSAFFLLPACQDVDARPQGRA
jgi:hypothetical protein